MDQLKLTTQQRQALERQLHQAQNARSYRRTLAVLEYSRGRPVAQIAQMLSVTRQSVYNWIDAYARQRQPSALLDEARSGRPRLLTEPLQAQLLALLDTTPDRLGYFARTWSVPLLAAQMQAATGIVFSDETIRRVLHQQRFVWKRPRYVLAPDPDREKKTLSFAHDQAAGAANRRAG